MDLSPAVSTPCYGVVNINDVIIIRVFLNCFVGVGELDVGPCGPMQPIQVEVEVVLIME